MFYLFLMGIICLFHSNEISMRMEICNHSFLSHFHFWEQYLAWSWHVLVVEFIKGYSTMSVTESNLTVWKVYLLRTSQPLKVRQNCVKPFIPSSMGSLVPSTKISKNSLVLMFSWLLWIAYLPPWTVDVIGI